MMKKTIVKNKKTGQVLYKDIDENFVNQIIDVGNEYEEGNDIFIKPTPQETATFLNNIEQVQYLKDINKYKTEVKKNVLAFYRNFIKFNVISNPRIIVDSLSDIYYQKVLEIYSNFQVKSEQSVINLDTYVMKYKDPISGEYIRGKYSEILEIFGKVMEARRLVNDNVDFHNRAIDNILIKDQDNNIIYQDTIDAVNAYDYQKDELGNDLVPIADVQLLIH